MATFRSLISKSITHHPLATIRLFSFSLTTPFGTDRLTEEILDGEIPTQDGTWVDRLEAGPEDEDSLSDLLHSVNDLLDPIVEDTRLSQTAIEIAAGALDLELVMQDLGPVNVWKLFEGEDEVFEGMSLHIIDAELKRIAQEKQAARRHGRRPLLDFDKSS